MKIKEKIKRIRNMKTKELNEKLDMNKDELSEKILFLNAQLSLTKDKKLKKDIRAEIKALFKSQFLIIIN